MTKCCDIMTKNPVCHDTQDTADLLAKTMKNKDLGPIPIVDRNDGNKFVGVVTDRDLVLRVLAEGKNPFDTTAKEIMSKEVTCCAPDDDIKLAIDKMEADQIRRIPVVDSDHHIVGIIAQGDIALRLNEPSTTAEMVSEISIPEEDRVRTIL